MWVAKPAPNLATTCGKCSVQHRCVVTDDAASGTVLGEHKQSRDTARSPPEPLLCNFAPQSDLRVKRTESLVDARKLRFDLNDKEHPALLVPPQDVD